MYSPHEIVLKTRIQTDVSVIALFTSHLTQLFQSCILRTKITNEFFALLIWRSIYF